MTSVPSILIPASTNSIILSPTRRRAEGITHVERVPEPDPSVLQRRASDDINLRAKAGGVKYEKSVHKHYSAHYPGYVSGPWFRFSDKRNQNRLAQCDAIIFPDLRTDNKHAWPDKVLLVEVKTTHCLEAYEQLRGFYEPIVRAYLPGAAVVLVEVCRSFYRNVKWPEPLHFCDALSDVFSLPDGALAAVELLKVPQ